MLAKLEQRDKLLARYRSGSEFPAYLPLKMANRQLVRLRNQTAPSPSSLQQCCSDRAADLEMLPCVVENENVGQLPLTNREARA